MPESRPCKTKTGRPKVRWPNIATARWYLVNAPSNEMVGREPYRCRRCGGVHIGGVPGR